MMGSFVLDAPAVLVFAVALVLVFFVCVVLRSALPLSHSLRVTFSMPTGPLDFLTPSFLECASRDGYKGLAKSARSVQPQDADGCASSTSSPPLSRRLILRLLQIGGVEQNPGMPPPEVIRTQARDRRGIPVAIGNANAGAVALADDAMLREAHPQHVLDARAARFASYGAAETARADADMENARRAYFANNQQCTTRRVVTSCQSQWQEMARECGEPDGVAPRPTARASGPPGGPPLEAPVAQPATVDEPVCTCDRVPGKQGRHKANCARSTQSRLPTAAACIPSTTQAPPLRFTMDDIARLVVPVLDHIFPSVRLAAAQALERALRWGLEYVFAFAKLCLVRRQAGEVRKACIRFARGEVNELFDEVARLRLETPAAAASYPMDRDDFASDVAPEAIPPHTRQRAEYLARLGYLSRASSVLDCAKIAQSTEATVTALRKLHPAGVGIADTSDADMVPFQALTTEEVFSALKSISRGSSGGPSRLTRDALIDLIAVPGIGVSCLDLLTKSINELVLKSKTPDGRAFLRPFFGARLVAMEKKDGGVRPIAAGEITRRILGKVLCDRHSAVIGKKLVRDGQVGVGIPGGVELLFHATKSFADTMADEEVVLKTDISNAFNSIKRQSIWDAVVDLVGEIPSVADLRHYLRAAYGGTTPLYYRNGDTTMVIESQEGCQQGDPSGPLFFAIPMTLAIRDALGLLAAEHPESNVSLRGAMLDDLVVGSTCETVRNLLKHLVPGLASIGLKINLAKCESIGVHETPHAPLDVSIPHKTTAEWELVGAPLGGEVGNVLAKKVAGLERKLAQFASLDSPHLALILTRYGGAYPKLGYWVRLLGEAGKPFWQQADAATIALVQSLAGCMPPNIHTVCHLPTRLGGLGLKDCASTAAAAHCASLSEAMSLVNWITSPEPEWWEQKLSIAESEVRQQGASLDGTPATKVQKFLSTQVHDATAARLLADTTFPTRTKCLMTAARSPLSNFWLNPVFPLIGSVIELPKTSFTYFLRFRLGLPLADSAEKCASCGAECDVYGDHALSCMRGGDKQRWHFAVTTELTTLASFALWQPKREVHPFPAEPTLRLDIALPPGAMPKMPNHHTLIDVAITNASVIQEARGPKKAGEVAEAYAVNAKGTKYGPHIDKGSQVLLPLVFETTGATTKDGQAFIRTLAKAVEARAPQEGGTASVACRIGSKIALCIANKLAKVFATGAACEGGGG